MPLAAVRVLRGMLPLADADPKITAGRLVAWLHITVVTISGAALLYRFTPRTFSNPALTIALLCASLFLANFKLRLPLWRGVSTISMACAADLLALMVLGA